VVSCNSTSRHSASRHSDRASATVELAVVAPVLVIFWLLAATFSTITTAHQRVEAAAQAAAQAAATAPDGGVAALEASTMVSSGLRGGRPCAQIGVRTDTAAFVPGGSVTVTVTCRLDLGGMAIPGIPPVATVSATATAPLDRYRTFA
jgi:Flp pilus assembly protein TadG